MGDRLAAKQTVVDTSNFDNNLSSADDTVQKALDTLDDMSTAGIVAKKIYDFGADNFDLPNNSDWGLNSPAAIIADGNNGALTVAAFDDSTAEGVGGDFYIPSGSTYLWLNFQHRAATSQSSSVGVDTQFRFRKITDNGAVGSWTTTSLSALSIPASDTHYHNDTITLSLSTIGMAAGAYYQWELTRDTSSSDDTLSGDWYLRRLRFETGYGRVTWIPADALLSIDSSDWSVNANAAIATDSNNAALKVRRFDDTTEEGAGFCMFVPSGIAKMKLHLVSRAETAPGSAAGVGITQHYRKIPSGAAVSSWVQYDLPTDISIPTNEYWQYDEWEIDLASLSTAIDAGNEYQFEITRNTADSGDTLSGDWTLLALGVEFY